MSLRVLLIATIATSFTLATSAFAQQPARPEVSVQKLRNAAAQDVVKALTTFAEQKGLAVSLVAEPVSNRVIVAGDASQMKQVIELITKIDSPPARVQAQLLIVEARFGFAKEIGLAEGIEESWSLTDRETRMLTSAIRNAKEVKILSRPHLMIADNQTGVIEVGDETFGYSVHLTPRVMPQGLLARIEASVKKPTTLDTIQTTVKTADGETTVFRLPYPPVAAAAKNEVLLVMTLHVLKN